MKLKILLICLLGLLLTACQAESKSVCEDGALTYQPRSTPFPARPEEPAGPQEVEINGKLVKFEQVIQGPLCNQAVSGKVYVACRVQVYAWEKAPNFLDGCNFQVAEGTVIRVAAHNNAEYFNGCAACHTSAGGGAP